MKTRQFLKIRVNNILWEQQFFSILQPSYFVGYFIPFFFLFRNVVCLCREKRKKDYFLKKKKTFFRFFYFIGLLTSLQFVRFKIFIFRRVREKTRKKNLLQTFNLFPLKNILLCCCKIDFFLAFFILKTTIFLIAQIQKKKTTNKQTVP